MKIHFKSREEARKFKRQAVDPAHWQVRKSQKLWEGVFPWEAVRVHKSKKPWEEVPIWKAVGVHKTAGDQEPVATLFVGVYRKKLDKRR